MPTRAEARPVYEKLLATVQITQWGQEKAAGLAKIILGNKGRYEAVEAATGVPWQFIAAVHHMECSGSFSQHLANGDPIAAPTIHVPAGIPGGTWEECAIAALKYKAWDPALSWADWLTVLYRAEAYNGFGYWHKHPTPYVWYGTTVCPKKGKYVSDGRYDPDAESQQVGVYPILVALGLKCLVDYGKSTTQITQRGTMADIKLVTGQATWLKSSTAQSSDPSSDPKIKLQGNLELNLAAQPTIKAGHYEVTLTEPYMGVAKGYIWANHATIEGDDPDEVGTKPTAPPIDPKDKRAIQRELSRIGLLDGRKGFDDGKWGGLSESAWRAWCRHYGANDTAFSDHSLAALQQAKGYADLDLRPKDPSKASHKIAALCLRRMLELKMWLAVSMGSDKPAWNFFYLRGTNPDGSFNKDSIDNMNDLRILAKINPDGTVEVGYISIATWDAGWHYRKNRMNSNGCFQIDYDRQFWSWRPGIHGVAAPHPALTQQDDGDPVTGTRDDDENGRTATDRHYEDGGAVNHHGTVGRKPGQPVSVYSAGCGVDDDIDAHLEIFMPKMKSDRRTLASGGHLINCCFLDRSKVQGLPLA